MRILQICNKAPYPANDGSSIAIYNMAHGIIENGHELYLLTINTKKHFKDDASVPQHFKDKAHYHSIYNNTSPTPFGALLNLLLSSNSYFICRFYFKEFEDALTETLQKNTFDIVQLEGLFMAPYIDTIRKHSKAKIALRAHNIEHLIWERHIAIEKSGLKRWYLNIQNTRLKKYEEEIFQKVDTIITITPIDEDYILKKFPKLNVRTSYTGVNVNEYDLNSEIKLQENTVFSFGSMDWIPNIEAVDWFLKNCWLKVLAKHPQCKFIIAGRNMPQRFKDLASDKIVVIENVQNPRDFYSTYAVMLVPLLSGSGLRIKIVEGMAYGKAIASTEIGAEGITYQNGKDMMVADNAEKFIEAVDLLLNPAERERIGKNAKLTAGKYFDNVQITKQLVDHYQRLN